METGDRYQSGVADVGYSRVVLQQKGNVRVIEERAIAKVFLWQVASDGVVKCYDRNQSVSSSAMVDGRARCQVSRTISLPVLPNGTFG